MDHVISTFCQPEASVVGRYRAKTQEHDISTISDKPISVKTKFSTMFGP